MAQSSQQPKAETLYRYVGRPEAPFGSIAGKIAFMHIPRSGGTSLRAILTICAALKNTHYAEIQGTLYGQFLGNNKPDTVEQLELFAKKDRPFTSIAGHYPYACPPLITGDISWITTVRDPAARLQSHYLFGASRGGWDVGTPIEDLFAEGKLIDNPMTRQFAGLTSANSHVSTDTLKQAKEHAAKFFAIAGTQNLDDLVAVLLAALNLDDILYEVSNTSKGSLSGALKQDVAAASEQRNAFDIELLSYLTTQPNYVGPQKLRTPSDTLNIICRAPGGSLSLTPASRHNLEAVKDGLRQSAKNPNAVAFFGI